MLDRGMLKGYDLICIITVAYPLETQLMIMNASCFRVTQVIDGYSVYVQTIGSGR